jgi:hypothetical protein
VRTRSMLYCFSKQRGAAGRAGYGSE